MSNLALEVGNLDGLVVLILLIMFGSAILLGIIGIVLMAKNKKKTGKILLILAGVYMLVSFGVCGSMIVGF
ncbi:hypothetical protein NYZ99_19720 [Maribacter litopenaei]|uniref:PEP-CTERM protein-sorting domain-containing protein n=1 Tax=Maribacter litopenaei TaxID=2976127 RepID=A0ABY5YAH6_9FLAO|nr:hypothetical protein [Maribacter litopenaei]UWX54931.1 hypothetical protein NYZ99_19720 [Maribacter litopenaei]